MPIPTWFFRSETAEKLREEGRREGRVRNILLLLQLRDVEVTDAVRERMAAPVDDATRDLWFSRALIVDRAEDIFTAPGRLSPWRMRRNTPPGSRT
ncbi:hypothetical protein OG552_08845 [Streptomyces sp. NBC_01476]|uniref:hypothetical protein n=1 Tax=Streptomyces sp. NBC_01476 TaxID=2903881 RepID=UPI002E302F55|nr:hypothetical protein [Streptomyces sp. NBC_01476]